MTNLKWRKCLRAVKRFFLAVAGVATPFLILGMAAVGVIHLGLNPVVIFAVGVPSLIAGVALALFVHELGHVIEGHRAGIRISRFFIGPICIFRTNGKLKAYRSGLAWSLGNGIMTLAKDADSNKALRAYFLGGSLAIACFAVALGAVVARHLRKAVQI